MRPREDHPPIRQRRRILPASRAGSGAGQEAAAAQLSSAAGALPAESPRSAGDPRTKARRIVDLTLPIEEGMTTFPRPWHPTVEVTILGRHGIEGRQTRKLVLGTHTGTHCDAPRHFIPGGGTVSEISIDTLIGPAVVLDFSRHGKNQEVTVADLEQSLRDRRPSRLLLRFDWCRHVRDASYYTDHPYLGEDAAAWLVRRGVRLLGMDTPMPDDPRGTEASSIDSPVHKILLGSGVVLVEYLCNLAALETDEVELIVLPLKITDGDGSPVRCVALETCHKTTGERTDAAGRDRP